MVGQKTATANFDQVASIPSLIHWHPELGWLLLATKLSVLLDRGYGTVCRAM